MSQHLATATINGLAVEVVAGFDRRLGDYFLHHPRIDGHRRAAQRLRQDNAVLREQIARMAALVDHYFAAWQETRLLLQRRDRELAESRHDAKMRVVSIAPEHRGG